MSLSLGTISFFNKTIHNMNKPTPYIVAAIVVAFLLFVSSDKVDIQQLTKNAKEFLAALNGQPSQSSQSRPATQDELVETFLSYTSQPLYSNDDLVEQVCDIKGLELEAYDVLANKIYFSLPKDTGRFDVTGLTDNVENLSFLRPDSNGRISLSNSHFLRVSDDKTIFSINKRDIKIDSSKTISVSFFDGSVVYLTNLEEMRNSMRNQYVYGGRLYIKYEKNGIPYRIVNHSAYISKKSDPSIARLVNSIIKDDMTMEQKVQVLSNFVSNGIKWDNHGITDREIMKKPMEILFSGKIDCSGKTTLLASMLEQIGAQYVLVYYDDHINLAVKGDFDSYNDLIIGSGDNKFHIVEATVPGFKIGKTFLVYNRKPKFVQFPDDNPYHYETGQKVDFL